MLVTKAFENLPYIGSKQLIASNLRLHTISSLVSPPAGFRGLSNAVLGLRVNFPTVNLGLSCIFSIFARSPSKAVTSSSTPAQSLLGVPVNLLGAASFLPGRADRQYPRHLGRSDYRRE